MLAATQTTPGKQTGNSEVHRYGTCHRAALSLLLDRYGLRIEPVAPGQPIAGSYWGDGEAGLIGRRLLVRPDTPVHSILHEAGHFICMDTERRNEVHTNAGGDYDEENAVCYLQIVLAGLMPGMGRERMFRDMDAWGYTFRLGSARSWFEQDAGDARLWLVTNGLLGSDGHPSWKLRK